MWSLFYRRPRLLILTICLIVFWGLSAFNSLPRTEDPETAQRYVSIITQFPGASAERVESLVTDKIERELTQIAEVETITSASQNDSSLILLKLQPVIDDVDRIWSQVRDRLSSVALQLPSGSSAPIYKEFFSKANSLIAAVTWDLDTPVNYAILSRMAEELENELRDLPGTQKVELSGQPREEIAVEIDADRLAMLGLTPQGLAAQIAASDTKVSAGQLRNQNNLPLAITALDSTQRIEQIPLKTSQDKQLALVGDVAKVTRGIKQPASELAIINGKPAVVVAVLMESDRRIDRWSLGVRKAIDDFEQQLSPGIDIEVIFDQSIYVENRLNDLFSSLLIGTVCVIGTTLVMMGWRSGLIVGATSILSVLAVFGCMQRLAVPLNQMSVIGLVIALGMLIDNAIVVVDEMNALLKKGERAKTAIAQSLDRLAIPLIASTLTTVITFLPIVLLPGDTGEFVRSIGISTIAALTSSLLISLTIVPVLAGRVNRRLDREETNWWQKGLSLPKLTTIYRRSVALVLSKPTWGIVLALMIPAIGFLMSPTIELQLFSPVDRDRFYVELELPPQASITQTEATARKARQLILQSPEVVDVQLFLAKNPPEFYYNTDRWRESQPYYAQAVVRLESFQHSRRVIKSLQTKLDRALTDTRVLVRQLEQGEWFPAPIELRIYGTDILVLQQLGDRAREILAGVTDIIHVRNSLSDIRPQIALDIDAAIALVAGFDGVAIASQLDAHLEGFVGGSILEENEDIPIRVRLGNRDRQELDSIAGLNLVAQNQQNANMVPLSAIAQIELKPEIAVITRRNGKRVNNIQGFITAGVLPAQVRSEFRQRLAAEGLELPPGYTMEWGGEFETLNNAIDNLKPIAGILVLATVSVLVLSFSSFRLAGIISLVGISSIGLGLASLWVFGYPLGFMSVLGIFGLIGVAINDSIVVLAALCSDLSARQGDLLAIQQVVVRSTRHVLTTSITTVAGFVPLFLQGGEFWTPLAVSIAGGIVGATLLALFFVPCAYLLLIKSQLRKYS